MIIQPLITVCAFMTVVIASLLFFHQSVWPVFSQHMLLNGIILFVMGFGIALNLHQLYRLWQEKKWFDHIGHGRLEPYALFFLKPLAVVLENDQLPSYIQSLTLKSILSSVEGRLQESRDIPRYCIRLLVFLGLLGTFWGLSQTIVGIASIISHLDMTGENAFQTLKQGLNMPLTGMGTAFSCSMFGLAGSLLVGFLDLQIGRAGMSFYNYVEEKLSTLTRLSSTQNGVSGAGPAFSMGLLEQAIEGMAHLQDQLRKNEDSRLTMMRSVQLFSEKLSEMSEYIIAHQGFSQKLAQHQIDLQETLTHQASDGTQGRNLEIIKTHMRSVDATLTKLLEETVEGRNRSLQEIRQEIRFVTRTLSALANGQESP